MDTAHSVYRVLWRGNRYTVSHESARPHAEADPYSLNDKAVHTHQGVEPEDASRSVVDDLIPARLPILALPLR